MPIARPSVSMLSIRAYSPVLLIITMILLTSLACGKSKKHVPAKQPVTDTVVQGESAQTTRATYERKGEYDSATAQPQSVATVDSNSAPAPRAEQDAQELAVIIESHNGDLAEGEACAEAGFTEERCKAANLILAKRLANRDRKDGKKGCK